MALAQNIREYGIDGVYGRPLYYREIVRMNAAKSIVYAYESRQGSANFAAWALSNPNEARILSQAEILASKDDRTN